MEEKVKQLVEKSIENKEANPPAVVPEEEAKLQEAMNEININDRNSVIYFGSKAQEKLDDISNKMLDGVKNKDTGKTGDLLNNMVATIRGFDIDEFNPNKKLSWWQKLFGATKPLAKFV